MLSKLLICQSLFVLANQASAYDMQFLDFELDIDAIELELDSYELNDAPSDAVDQSQIAYIRDRVKSLPEIGQLPEETFAGFIELNRTSTNIDKKLFYSFVKSQNNPETDPVLLWSNGGPGCSSFIGYLQELGPWIIPDHFENVEKHYMEEGFKQGQFYRNAYSWNKNASVLIIEQPAGVGFSTCVDNTEEDKECDMVYTDDSAADDFTEAILKWFEMFPDFKQNDFYMSGESYAGMYIPLSLYRIDKHNEQFKEDDTVFKPNVKGMLIVNGVTNYKYDDWQGMIEFGYGHFLLSETYYQRFKTTECPWEAGNGSPEWKASVNYAVCEQILIDFIDVYSGKIDIYNILAKCDREKPVSFMEQEELYGVSLIGDEPKYYKKFQTAQQKVGKLNIDMNPQKYEEDYVLNLITEEQKQILEESLKKIQEKEEEDKYECVSGKPLIAYLNRDDVREALHIPKENPAWNSCNDQILYRFEGDRKGSQFVWDELKGKYKMLKLSGDLDMVVPTWGTYRWMQGAGREIYESWRPYYVADQLAGFTVKYDGMTLATVKGAGHMVPMYKPRESYYLLSQFINGEIIGYPSKIA